MKSCPRGKIRRIAFVRKDGTRVPSSCVADTGAPGKTPARARVLPKPKPGMLHGWKGDADSVERRAALRKAVRAEGCAGVIRRLTLERNFTHKTSPRTSAAAWIDARWLHGQGFCKLKTKSR